MKTSKGHDAQHQRNQRADALNSNKGTNGTNIVNAHVHGNRGKQLNPNQGGSERTVTPIASAQRRTGK